MLFVDDDWSGATNGSIVGEGLVVGTGAFATIQQAIARAQAGDEVQIAEGSYAGPLVVNKSLRLVGAGADKVTLDVSASASAYAVSLTASNVELSGLTVHGSPSNGTVLYGVNASGRSGLVLEGLVVEGVARSGINLNGATDVSISGVVSRDNGGAGFFFTDVKNATLTDVTTSGNAWTGVGFSTSGRSYAAGVTGVVIAGASRFGEAATANGAVMFEEARWNPVTASYNLDDPVPITFSTNPADGADVTFAQAVPLPYALSGPQDDNWPVRRRFYETLGQGLAAAAGSPEHYLPQGRVLATVGAAGAPRYLVVAPNMSIQDALDAADPGDVVRVLAGTYAENLVIDAAIVLEPAGDGDVVLRPASGDALTIRAVGSDGSTTRVRGLLIEGGDRGVVFDATASHVVLGGLSISGTGVGVAAADGAALSDLAIEDAVVAGNGAGFQASAGGSVEGLVVARSRFDDNDGYGFVVLAGPAGFTGVSVSDSTFDRNGLGGLRAERLDDASFSNVSVRDNGGTGVDLDLAVGDYAGLAFDGVTAAGNAGWGIEVKASEAAGSTASGVEVGSSVVAGNGGGLRFGERVSGAVVRWNRIVGNGPAALANASADAVDAAYNWWGSNDGPGAAASGAVASAPYIVLRLAAPGEVLVGQAAAILADLTHDSEGNDVSSLGLIPGGGTVGFAATLGALGSTSAALVDGSASNGFEAGATPGPATISATFDGATATATVQVLAPSLAISGPSAVDQGSPYTLSLQAGEDAGAVSRWWIDWGDGTTQEVAGSPASAGHVYAAPASYTIRAWAETPLGVYEARDAVSAVVLNVAPTAAIAGGPSAVDQGAQVQFSAAASDPGGALAFSWTATLGDAVIASGSGESFAFTPAAAGEYRVVLTVVDAQGESAVASTNLVVANVGPTLDVSPIADRFDAGATVALAASATDPNPSAALAYSWVVRRDGEVVAAGDRPTLELAALAPGLYEAVVRVTDGEGGAAERSVRFEVVAPAAPETPVDPQPETPGTPVGPLSEPAQRVVESVAARAEVQVQRQDARVAAMVERYGEDPPPVVQRMIQRAVQAKVRIQVMAARRVIAIQRAFTGMGRGRR